jgi:hypothetical protein
MKKAELKNNELYMKQWISQTEDESKRRKEIENTLKNRIK